MKTQERRRLLGKLAETNESLKLELSGSWEPRTVKTLEKVVKKEDPNIVFLMETWSNREWMEQAKDRFKMKYGLIVPSNLKQGWSGYVVEGGN